MKPEHVIAICVAMIFACMAGLFGSLIPWPAGLRKEWSAGDWAAWFQAVGSILAIVAAFLVARRQERIAEVLRRKATDEDLLRALSVYSVALQSISNAIAITRAQGRQAPRNQSAIEGAIEGLVFAQSLLEHALETNAPVDLLHEIWSFRYLARELELGLRGLPNDSRSVMLHAFAHRNRVSKAIDGVSLRIADLRMKKLVLPDPVPAPRPGDQDPTAAPFRPSFGQPLRQPPPPHEVMPPAEWPSDPQLVPKEL